MAGFTGRYNGDTLSNNSIIVDNTRDYDYNPDDAEGNVDIILVCSNAKGKRWVSDVEPDSYTAPSGEDVDFSDGDLWFVIDEIT